MIRRNFLFAGLLFRKVSYIMSCNYSSIKPPVSVKGMTVLDRDAFSISAKIPYVAFDSGSLNEYLPKIKKVLLKLPDFKPVQDSNEDKGRKLCFLDSSKLDSNNVYKDNTIFGNLHYKEVQFGYTNFTADEILRAVLPEEGDVGGAGYSVVGHILHLNLRLHLEPYKSLIGSVLLDKVKNVKMVVNKAAAIENTFRNFNMEVIAGDKDLDTVVQVRENGCSFKFDFSKVYWNPRLSTEHERIVNLLSKGDILFDVFAGVGPFAVPAARKGVKVYANDLNPESFKWLEYNMKANKASTSALTFNLDGREFIAKIVRRHLPEHGARLHLLTVHCYCFVSKGDIAGAMRLIKEGLRLKDFDDSRLSVSFVRSVAPNKDMMRVSFDLKKEDLCKTTIHQPLESGSSDDKSTDASQADLGTRTAIKGVQGSEIESGSSVRDTVIVAPVSREDSSNGFEGSEPKRLKTTSSASAGD